MEMEMATRGFVFLLLIVASSTSTAQYKCSEKGKVIYQDHVCENGGNSEKIKVSVSPDAMSAADASLQVAQIKQRADGMQALRLATEQRRPLVGMSVTELEMAMGMPSRINSSANRSGANEQRIYERGGRTIYVYTDGTGTVTAFQDQAPIGSAKRSSSHL
jgi:hypothetical protein